MYATDGAFTETPASWDPQWNSELFPELNLEDLGGRFVDLKKAIESSYQSIEPFRELYKNLVESYAGPQYGDATDKKQCYINKMAQIVDAYMMVLAANRPAIDLTTDNKQLRPFAAHYELAMNNLIREIRLENTIRRWVLDAFFCVGVVRVHLRESAEVQFESDLWMDPGSPHASNVSLFDFVCDMSVRNFSECKYAGNMYQVTLQDLQEGVRLGMYDATQVREIAASTRKSVEGQSERLEDLSREIGVEEFMKTVYLADVWVARDRKIYTFHVTDRTKFIIKDSPIAVMDWDEPSQGPYHILGFNDVPDNIMPVSPAAHLDGLNRLINALYRKAARQAQRQKENPTYTPAATNDANRLKKANDGEWIQVQNGSQINVIKSSGADPSNVAFTIGAIEQIDSLAGNIPAMLGLGQQADTLGQEELIRNAGNRKIGQMQYRVIDATEKLIASLGFLLWNDEAKVIPGEVSSGKYTARSDWTPEDREGVYEDFKFGVHAYSMTYRPPAAQVETVNQLVTGVYAPMMEMLMSQGGTIDFAELTKRYAQNLGIEWLEDIVKFTAPPPQQSTGEDPGKPATTSRTYTRKSAAGQQDSPAEKQQMWMQMAAAGNQSAANRMGG